MRCLVTGGAGFIGSHVVRALLARGDSVRVLDDFSTGSRDNLAGLEGALEILEGDIRDVPTVVEAVVEQEAIVHLAAEVSVPLSVENPLRTASINTIGTLNLLESGRRAGLQRFVLASSCAVYGDVATAANVEDQALRPLSPYAASKLAAENYLQSHSLLHGIIGIALRYFNVTGTRQDPASPYAAVIPKFAVALARGEAPCIFGDGEQTRDFVHVDDVVRANLLALAAPAEARGRAFNIGTGKAVSLNALAATMAEVLERDIAPSHVAERAGDLRHSRANAELAAELLGWKAEVDLKTGLASTIPFYLEQE